MNFDSKMTKEIPDDADDKKNEEKVKGDIESKVSVLVEKEDYKKLNPNDSAMAHLKNMDSSMVHDEENDEIGTRDEHLILKLVV